MKRGLNLTEQTYERLRADLLACRIFPGEKLNIDSLSKQMGVSLGAIREALSRLTSEGLVMAEPSKGFRATPISAVELVDLTNVRIDIESQCLRRALANADAAWESKLQSAYRKLQRAAPRQKRLAPPLRTRMPWRTAFHEALVGACDSSGCSGCGGLSSRSRSATGASRSHSPRRIATLRTSARRSWTPRWLATSSA